MVPGVVGQITGRRELNDQKSRRHFVRVTPPNYAHVLSATGCLSGLTLRRLTRRNIPPYSPLLPIDKIFVSLDSFVFLELFGSSFFSFVPVLLLVLLKIEPPAPLIWVICMRLRGYLLGVSSSYNRSWTGLYLHLWGIYLLRFILPCERP